MTQNRRLFHRSSQLWWLAALWSLAPCGASAQIALDGPQIIVVPFAPSNLALPHPAHENAPVTLKAIVRNADCAQGYRVWWDTNLNGSFDLLEEADGDPFSVPVDPFVAAAGTDTIYDIGTTLMVPEVDQDRTLPINVRIRSVCDPDEEAFATYRIFVYDWAPELDPTKWSDEQLEILDQMAIQESMWWLHRQMFQREGEGSEIRGWLFHRTGGGHRSAATAAMLWVMALNGHQPAYPPGSINWFGLPQPEDFVDRNDAAWNADPYSESMIRSMNMLIAQIQTDVFNNFVFFVEPADEAETCGFDADTGEELLCPRIEGTTDGRGIAVGSIGVYVAGKVLGALSTQLHAMAGTPIQTGSAIVLGRRWEWLIQQLTDYLVWMQHDTGCSKGSWYYHHSTWYQPGLDITENCLYADASTTQWALIGLEGAEAVGRQYGVVVPNRAKYRAADALVRNQAPDGGSQYRSDLTDYVPGEFQVLNDSNFQITGGAFVGARWLGLHEFDPFDDSTPFSNGVDFDYSSSTAGQLRQAYDSYLAFTAAMWTNNNHIGSIGWVSRLWLGGDYLCGEGLGVYNVARCGNTYAMYSHQKGYRTAEPELLSVGGHDWHREFITYYVRAQDRSVVDYLNFGRIIDEFCGATSVTCHYAEAVITTGWAALALTPTLFNPKPVALGFGQPRTVTEGCVGGNSGRVQFQHWASFHPKVGAQIVTYQWDADESNGLWWETGAPPDFETVNSFDLFEFTYNDRGQYAATLRVLDDSDPVLADTTRIIITVDPAPNFAPQADAGGPYSIEVGDDLDLEGVAGDPNLGCGDSVFVDWDLNGDFVFDDAFDPITTVDWADLVGLAQGEPRNVTMRATDAANMTNFAFTQLTIYPREPVAEPTALPNPAACGQEIIFNGEGSYHVNPARVVEHYAWDVNGIPGVDAAGADPEFRFTYDAFGDYDATLTVTDDLGRQGSATITVSVNQGNVPPMPIVPFNEYIIWSGEDLVLDGSNSWDEDEECGDSIVSYQWDIDGNGFYEDPAVSVDAIGVNPIIPWADLNTLQWAADPITGLPTNRVRLRVTDTNGASNVMEFNVTIYDGAPVAVITPSANPDRVDWIVQRFAVVRSAWANLDGWIATGEAVTNLDGRGSYSPVPGVSILACVWDITDPFDFTDGLVDEFCLVSLTKSIEAVQLIDALAPDPPLPVPEPVPVSMRVIDSKLDVAVTTIEIAYVNAGATPPTADADPTGPSIFNVGQAGVGEEIGYHITDSEDLLLNAGHSFDRDESLGDGLRWYRWDLGDNAAWEAQIQDPALQKLPQHFVWTVTPAQLAVFGYGGLGKFDVRLQVEDNTGRTDEDTTTVSIYPTNPTAVAKVWPNPAACGQTVSFNGWDSRHPHPGIDIAQFSWDLDGDLNFDDGDGGFVLAAYNVFSFGGPFQVGLRVTDSRGNTDFDSVNLNITAANLPPVANPGGPYFAVMGEGVDLDGSASNDPDEACGDEIVSFEWDVRGDGIFDFFGQTVEMTDQDIGAIGIGGPGDYPVILRTTDRFGEQSTTETTLRILNGPKAIAKISDNAPACSQEITLDGRDSFTDVPGGTIVSYEWDVDSDGVYDFNGETISIEAVGPGFVAYYLRVTDDEERSDFTSVFAFIDMVNTAPVADAGGPYGSGEINGAFEPITLDGRASFDPDAPCDRIVEWAWDTDGDGFYGDQDLDGAGSLIGTDYTGELIENYVNPAWEPNTTHIIRLFVRDFNNRWSDPANAEINLVSGAPPVGRIISPHSDDEPCIGDEEFEIEFEIEDPEGDIVDVSAFIGGQLVGTVEVDTPDTGDPVIETITVDANDVSEGRRNIQLALDDRNGWRPIIDAGGAITFDRTPPAVEIGFELVANLCYDDDAVPDPEIIVVDALDALPVVTQNRPRNGCFEELEVTATDTCGNSAVTSREYRVGIPIPLAIDGPDNGQLVASASVAWEPQADAQCYGQVLATVTLDGGPALPYPESTLLDVPGFNTVSVRVPDCVGNITQEVIGFVVNGAPISIPGGPFRETQGDPLPLDGSQSQAPEGADDIAEYAWDLDGDGVFESIGRFANFDTTRSGNYTAELRVTDTLGLTDTAAFDVIIDDVDPVVDAGGPYEGDQGDEIQFDASGTEPGHPSDPLTSYRWQWGDGATDEGDDAVAPAHAYDEDGEYDVRLTVSDIDSSTTVLFTVTVNDVDPRISSLDLPDALFELAPMEIGVVAEPGAADDTIQSYEFIWDDGSDPDVVAADIGAATHSFRDAGEHLVTVRVHDVDSVSERTFTVTVREITLAELIELTADRIAAADLNDQARGELDGVEDWLAKAAWGERNGYRGNTLVALEHAIDQMVMAQFFGGDLEDTLWAFGRQLVRELNAKHDELIAPGGDGDFRPDDDFVRRSELFIGEATGIFTNDDFEGDVRSNRNPFRANDILAAAYEAWFYLTEAEAPCNAEEYAGFPVLDMIGEPPGTFFDLEAANRTNDHLKQAFAIMASEMGDYVVAPDNPPGAEDVFDAIFELTELRERYLDQVVGIDCHNCITDADALEMELRMMELAAKLFDSNTEGVWVRNWQSCLVSAIKFRVELSMRRVVTSCGLAEFNEISQRAQLHQNNGLRLVDDEFNIVAGLEFYIDRDTRCLMIQTYNECLVPAFPEVNVIVEYPDFCEDQVE